MASDFELGHMVKFSSYLVYYDKWVVKKTAEPWVKGIFLGIRYVPENGPDPMDYSDSSGLSSLSPVKYDVIIKTALVCFSTEVDPVCAPLSDVRPYDWPLIYVI